jgi:hypothetical protein
MTTYVITTARLGKRLTEAVGYRGGGGGNARKRLRSRRWNMMRKPNGANRNQSATGLY